MYKKLNEQKLLFKMHVEKKGEGLGEEVYSLQ